MNEPTQLVINLPDAAALAEEAARRIVEIALAAIADHGYFAWALSGGNTPVATYRLLAQPHPALSPWRNNLAWSRIHIFFTDERFVPHDHPDSNCLLLQESLLKHVPIPSENVHAVPIITPEQSATAYAKEILSFFAPRPPRFDLISLGMGPDGHTASLFPGMDDCGEQRVAAIHNSPKPPPTRITLTYRLLNQAVNALFIIKDKAGLLAEIAEDGEQSLPAGKINTAGRPVVWLAYTDG